jgi:hypothetical protein
MLDRSKKGSAVFMSFILVFSIFSIINIKEVSAEQPFCCIKSNDGQYCTEDEDRSVLEGSCSDLRMGECDAMSECAEVTCVPANGVCLSDYPKLKCEDEGGTPDTRQESSVPECQIGCCKETSMCGLIQNAQCPGEFDSSITDARSCDNLCAADELGCCWTSGSCEFGNRGDCPADYTFEEPVAGDPVYCSEVNHCDALYDAYAYTACGDKTLIPNANLDVYWYDSNGNMMEMVGAENSNAPLYTDIENRDDYGNCEYPDEKCYDPDEKGGREWAYCKSTACVLDCPECTPTSFRNGDTICLGIGGGKFTNEDRSKYLKEYLLSCDGGEVNTDRELDRTREHCVYSPKEVDGIVRYHAETINNNWAMCSGGSGNDNYCGEGGGIWDYGAYIPVLGGPLLALGDWCTNGFKMPGAYFGGDQSCGETGKIGDVDMCYYDHDLWAPIGSCNAVFPPATSDRCVECGKGGDGAVNICTEEECNSLGDCEFEHQNLNFDALLATGALAVGTAVSIQVFAEIACRWAGLGGGTEICKRGFLEGTKQLLGEKLYWGILALIVGTGASASQGYHSDGVTEYDFMTEDGKYDLAKIITLNKAIDTGIGGDEELSIGATLLAISLRACTGSGDVGNAGETIEGVDNILPGEGADVVASPTNPQKSISICNILNSLGIVLSVYGMSESFNAGECRAETPYTDNNKCGQCGPAEGQFYCTNDRCNILGQSNNNCKWISKDDGTIDGWCIPVDPTNINPPAITDIRLEMYDVDGLFVEPEYISDRQILDIDQRFDWTDANNIKLNITTDVRSDCKASFEAESSFEGMDMALDNPFDRQHNLDFNLTEHIKIPGEATLFIKCENVNGVSHNPSEDINWIRMRFGSRPDTVPPEILVTDPYLGFYFPNGTDDSELSIVVYDNNGVGGCRYSTDLNETDYDEMENTFDGPVSVACPGISDENCYKFTTSLDFSTDGEEIDLSSLGYEENGTRFDYSFGCIDQFSPPNLFTMDYVVSIFPDFEMNLTSPEEDEEIYDSTPWINASTNVDTQCSYKLQNDVNWTEINEDVLDQDYRYEIEDALDGSVGGIPYTMTVRCHDLAFNFQEESVMFYILADEDAPYPARIYTTGTFGSGGSLYIQLNEPAECRFTVDDDDFDFDEGDDSTLMRAVLPQRIESDRLISETQTTSWDSDIYYIKCRDEWENEGEFTIYP